MALTKCIECELQISDKALSCPHCGYPINGGLITESEKKKKAKRRRLPNGFGTITKLNDSNLRNPYRAMVCVGKTSTGKPIHRLLKPHSYFRTYHDAYSALFEYNKNPYDLDQDITVLELYEKWSKEYFDNVTDASVRTITAAWAYCSSVYTMRAKDLRARHIKGCMDNGFRIETNGRHKGQKKYPSAGMKARIKSAFNIMLDYGLEYEIVDKNYARTFEISDDIVKEKEDATRGHIIFTEDELNILWAHVNKIRYVDWILIQCYMGWRPQELATLKLEDVRLNQMYMCAGMKTKAGKQRIVPIHSKIKGLVQRNYDKALSLDSEYLFNDKGQTHSGLWKLTYDKYSNRFKKVISELNLNSEHRPHDCRKTFITRCKRAGVDEYALKEMVGHNIKDITESVYTVRDLEWLRSDLEKMQ